MAKRYTVRHTIPIENPDQGQQVAFNETVDLAILLSQRLQRNVRQGHVFNIHSVKASIDPVNEGFFTGEYDLGMAVAGELHHCPATKNSVKAWQHLFGVWRKQKRLSVGAVGPQVRYDDFEVGWNNDFTTSRTSAIFTTGMADDTQERVVIFGGSVDGEEVTLQDTYTALQPQPQVSRFPISNTTVKAAKYTSVFPSSIKTAFTTHLSSTFPADGGLVLGAPDSGATASTVAVPISDRASLCGVVKLTGHILAEDTTLTVADEAFLHIDMTVSIGTPLVKTTKRRKSRKSRKSNYKPRRRWMKRT